MQTQPNDSTSDTCEKIPEKLQVDRNHFRLSWKKTVLYTLVLTLFLTAPLSALQAPHPDHLSSLPWWNAQINLQAEQNRGKTYTTCLFGDSISSGLGQTLGESNVNFGTGGLSTVSLITQLQILQSAQVGCQNAIVAIGTNDAMYVIKDAEFVANLRESVRLVKSLGTQQIILIPAFYSTVQASLNPMAAGPLSRVDEINQLMEQVALEENLPIISEGLEELYENNSLRSDVTFDGVHLNEKGKTIYRSFLLKLMS